jgi:GIY-YIG catalytic domain
VNLNELLGGKGVDPRAVLVLRHCPWEREFNKVLPFIAAEKPDWFNAYQQTQGEKLEKAMTEAGYVASFIGHEPGKALFIGLYKIGASRPLTYAEYWEVPANQQMKALGMRGFTGKDRSSVLWFDLELMDFYLEWKGKLIVEWPPPERSWWPRAHRNVIPVRTILEDSALDAPMKRWDELDFTWSELSILPKRLQAKLSEWRGIYYIFDRSDGKGYVGSAYGSENLLGRWRNYAKFGQGGNRLLRQRDPVNFHFTILELVAPMMEADEVIRRENTWKERLHTRKEHGGLNDN